LEKLFVLGCIADTLWYTWLYNKPGSSILDRLVSSQSRFRTKHDMEISNTDLSAEQVELVFRELPVDEYGSEGVGVYITGTYLS
jgi:hypothetical protein